MMRIAELLGLWPTPKQTTPASPAARPAPAATPLPKVELHLPECIQRHFGAPMKFAQPRAWALLAVFIIHHPPLAERKQAMAAALHDAGVDARLVHWVERFSNASEDLSEVRRCFFHPSYTQRESNPPADQETATYLTHACTS